MQPYPRIRKAIKWGGLLLTMWCGAVWLASLPHSGGIWLGRVREPWNTWLSRVPFWTPTALLAVATAAAWHLDALAHRRARLNLCPTCRYDRADLASPSAPCPECGSPPPSPRSAA